MTIGQRAAKAIKERAWANDTNFIDECSLVDCSDAQFRAWGRGKANPCARVLAEMYKQGYDIPYILTGVKDNG